MFRSRALLPGCRQGFTLIELLVVITIILVLAGLVISVVGNVQYKSSFARATSEIKAMETAMESYKVDNGAYPRDPAGTSSVTDKLDPKTSYNGSAYIDSSKFLYKALTGFVSNTAKSDKAYMTFTPSQLLSTASPATLDTTYIVDPWGVSYGYSTICQTVTDGSAGYNPTFDLWSTAGYGSSGKNYTTTGLTTDKYNTLWAKNW